MNDNNFSFSGIDIGDYVWWKIEDQDYAWIRPFDQESGIRKAYYTSKLPDGTSIMRFTMQGIGKVVNILNLNEEGFVSPASSLHKLKLNDYFVDSQKTDIVYPKSVNFPQNKFCLGVIFLVQCRNNCLIYLRDQDVSEFNRVNFETYKDDYMEQLQVSFADDTKPQSLYEIDDIVSWYADNNQPADLYFYDQDDYCLNSKTLESCNGLIVDMVWYENPYSFTYIECAEYLTYNYNSEEIPMYPVMYLHKDYTGWVYGVMTSIDGIPFVIWTPEENVYTLDFDGIYTPLMHDQNNPIYINKDDLEDDEFTTGCIDFIIPWCLAIDDWCLVIDEDEEALDEEDYSEIPFDFIPDIENELDKNIYVSNKNIYVSNNSGIEKNLVDLKILVDLREIEELQQEKKKLMEQIKSYGTEEIFADLAELERLDKEAKILMKQIKSLLGEI